MDAYTNNVQISNAEINPTGSGTLAVTYGDTTGNGASGTGKFLVNSGDLVFGSSASLTINGNPFTLVTNAAGLEGMVSSGNYALADNVGLTGTYTGPLVSGTYTGSFEGLGNSISGLTITNASASNLGLFSQIGTAGTVKNLTLSNGSITGSGSSNDYFGMLAGQNSGLIDNVTVTGGSVTGYQYTGGLVGSNTSSGSITNSEVTNLTVTGTYPTGLIAGHNFGTIDANTTANSSGTVNQSPLALTGSISAGSSTYGSALNPGAATFNNVLPWDSLTATVAVNTAGNTSSSGHLKAGSYTGIEQVSGLSGTDASDYTFSGVTGNYVVNKLALTAAIAASSSSYGSALNPGAVTLSGSLTGDLVSVGGATVNTSTVSTSGHPNAGSYTQSVGSTLGGTDAGDYTFAGSTTPTANYAINPLALTAAIAASSSSYGSALNPGAVTLSGSLTGDLVSVGGATVNTSTVSTSGHPNAGSYTQSVGSTLGGTDAGDYTFAGSTTPTANYAINPLALTAAIAASSSSYGSALNPGAVTLSGSITGDLVSVGGATVNTSTLSSSGHPIVGSYTQTAGTTLSGTDASDYTFAGFTSASNYQVNRLALTAAAIASSSSTYGAALNPGAVTLSGSLTGDLVSVGGATVNTSTVSTSGHPNAGSYTQSVGSTLRWVPMRATTPLPAPRLRRPITRSTRWR